MNGRANYWKTRNYTNSDVKARRKVFERSKCIVGNYYQVDSQYITAESICFNYRRYAGVFSEQSSNSGDFRNDVFRENINHSPTIRDCMLASPRRYNSPDADARFQPARNNSYVGRKRGCSIRSGLSVARIKWIIAGVPTISRAPDNYSCGIGEIFFPRR